MSLIIKHSNVSIFLIIRNLCAAVLFTLEPSYIVQGCQFHTHLDMVIYNSINQQREINYQAKQGSLPRLLDNCKLKDSILYN